MSDSESILRAAEALRNLSDPHLAADGLCALIANTIGGACVALVARCQRSNDILGILAEHPAGTILPPKTLTLPVAAKRRRVHLHLWRPGAEMPLAPEWLTRIAADLGPLIERLERIPHRLTASIDAETGFWTRREFIDQIDRRFERLDVEQKYAALLVFGWCRDGDMPAANATVVRASAERLRDMFRPSDVLARLAETRLAAWCDDMDHLVGAERASRIATALQTPLRGSDRYCMVGITARRPGSVRSAEKLLEIATSGLDEARAVALSSMDTAVRITGLEPANA